MTVLLSALLTSLPVAALCWLAGALFDRNADRFAITARVREGVWSGLLALPVFHVAAVVAGAKLLPAWLKAPSIAWTPIAPLAAGPAPAPASETAAPSLALPWPAIALAVMALGALVSLGLLALRHVRLARLTYRARPCGRSDLIAAVASRAASMGIKTPAVLTCPELTSPRLAGLLRPALLLPDDLARLPAEELALICGHELAHLKQRDNLRLAIEDVLLALFWFNPVMPAIRGRLAAAREEGRDDLALAGVAPESRRRYAETLVQTLRLGAGPEPHAAFIGAGRSIAAMRLNAILKPRPPMSPRVAITTLLTAAALSLVVAAGSGALAMVVAPPGTATPLSGASTPPAERAGGGVSFRADEAVEQRDGPMLFKGAVEVRLDRVTGDPTEDARLAGVTFLIDGAPAPAGFDPATLPPERIERVELVEGSTNSGQPTYQVDIILGTGTKTPSVRARSSYHMRNGPRERYADADAVAYQGYCASDEPGPVGFCAGVLFGLSDKSGACVPEETDDKLLVDKTLPVIAAGSPKAGEPMRDFATRSLRTAFPCPA
ncbi:MAG: M56 family metallopeptidase [Caulobacter sp.]|nr:M56 family metallopeptidase [Caulobacter sp.]